jgi:hypothetical protein
MGPHGIAELISDTDAEAGREAPEGADDYCYAELQGLSDA